MNKEKNVILRGESIYLRVMSVEDTDLIIKWRNRDFVRQNFIYRELFTVQGHHKWIENMIDTGKAVQFIIYIRDDEPVGSAYFRDIDKERGEAEYGIFIGEEDALGRGIGTQVAKLMLSYAFEELKLFKVKLRVLAENERARKSYERAGFLVEQGQNEKIHLEDGIHEVVFMSCINPAKQIEERG